MSYSSRKGSVTTHIANIKNNIAPGQNSIAVDPTATKVAVENLKPFIIIPFKNLPTINRSTANVNHARLL